MKPLDFALLADENIHPDVIAYLRQQECDIRSVVKDDLIGQSDRAYSAQPIPTIVWS